MTNLALKIVEYFFEVHFIAAMIKLEAEEISGIKSRIMNKYRWHTTVCQYNKNWMDTIGILYSLVILQQSL